ILSCDHYIREGMLRLFANKQDGGVDVVMNYRDSCFSYLKASADLLKYADVIF
ncbi:hypothetical protein LPJ61_002030, partial [Coemansia biformis]